MPFKMMGKSPLMKKLVGKQGNLPENLKAAIKAAPGKMVSPLKETEYAKNLKAARAAGMTQYEYNKKMKVDKAAAERAEKLTGAATANQNAGQTFQDLQKKIAERNSKQEVKETVPTEVKKPVQGKSFLSTGSVSAGKGSIKMPSTSGSLAMPSFTSKASQSGKKVINRGSSFTDEFGNTYNRSVKGRKKADGSSYKTISNKTNNNTTSEKDVAKGPKVKGKRRSKTVVKTKFDSKGNVRKVVEKTRGQKRKSLSDSEIIKRRENLKADRKKRDESPTKMKTKTPSKMMKKAPSKMMKKKSVKKADLKAAQSFSKSSKSKYNAAVANKSKSTPKPTSKSDFLSKLESKGTIKSSKNLTAAEKKKLASTKTGPAKMMKKKKK